MRSGTRCPFRASALLLLLLTAGLAAGCVTRGTHQEVLDECSQLSEANRRLEEQLKLLNASNESLGAERVARQDGVGGMHVAQPLLGPVLLLQHRLGNGLPASPRQQLEHGHATPALGAGRYGGDRRFGPSKGLFGAVMTR